MLSRSKKDQTLVVVESLAVETGRARDVVKKMLSRKVHGMVRGEYNTPGVASRGGSDMSRVWQGRDNRYAADSTMVIVNQGILKI